MNKWLEKNERGVILVIDIDIGKMMIYVQKVDEERQLDKEEIKNKRAKTFSHDVGKKGNGYSSVRASIFIF